MPRILALLAAATLCAPYVGAQSQRVEQRAMLREKLQIELLSISKSFDGLLGAEIIDLTDSTSVGVNDRLIFPTGSSIKVAILLELFRRSEQHSGLLKERRAVTAAMQVGGTGVSQFFADGSSMLSLEDLAVLMINLSDNTATNILIDEVGMDSVNHTLEAMGLRNTKLQRKMIRPDASARGEENLSTPAEAAALMARLARCELPVSKASCARMRAILEMPKDHPVREPLPANIRVAFKPGDVEGVAAVWAVIALPDRPYVLTVMTNYGAETNGRDAIRKVSEVAYKYFSKLARATPYGLRVPADAARRRP